MIKNPPRFQAILLWITFLISIVFLFTPRGPKVDIFLCVDYQREVEDLFYYGGEHYGWIIAASIMLYMAKQIESFRYYVLFFKFFMIYQILDFCDFILTYNSVWFHIFNVPISMNVLSGFIMTYLLGCLIFEEIKNNYGKH